MKMMKDLLFAVPLVLIGVLLFLLGVTGMTAHIILSVAGIVILVVYAIMTKKEWKLPIVEIIMRVAYALALVSGIVIYKVEYITALAITHKILAGAFVALLVFLVIHKAIKNCAQTSSK